MKSILLVLLMITYSTGWLIKKKHHTTTASGCVRCYGVPIPFVKIQLKDKDLFIDDTMATSRTRADGCFTITGKGRDGFSGKPDPYIKVEYTYSGSYGKMEVEKIVFGHNHYDKTSARRYSRYIHFGNIHIKNINCKSYVKFYQALKNFRIRAKRNIPGGTLHIRTGVLLHGGTAYAMTNLIRLPSKYKPHQITTRLATHELAHIVRHRYDGNGAHFAWDAVRFWYLRSHQCGTKSNNGYAFNEGWAEYWAGSCHGSYGLGINQFNYEGNVAKALRQLKVKCKSNDGRFTNVLRWNPRKIHSFQSFNYYHKKYYHCKIICNKYKCWAA